MEFEVCVKMKIWLFLCVMLAAACAPAAALEPRLLNPEDAAPLSMAPADLQAFVEAFYASTLNQDLKSLEPELRPRGWAEDLNGDGANEWILSEPLFTDEEVHTGMILHRDADGWRMVYRETGPFLMRINAETAGGWRNITGVYNVAAAPRGGYGMFRTLLAWNGAEYAETDPPLEYYRVISADPMLLFDAPGPVPGTQAFDLVEPGACVAATAEGDERFSAAGQEWIALNRPVPGYALARDLAPEPRCELAFAFSRMLFESAAGPLSAARPDKPFEPTDELAAWLRRTLAPRVALEFCKTDPVEYPREIAIHRVLETLPFAVARPFQDARSFYPHFAPAAPDKPEGAVAIRFRQVFESASKPVTWVFTSDPTTFKYRLTLVRHACEIPLPKPEPKEKQGKAAVNKRPEKNRLEAWEENPGGAPNERDSNSGINFKELYPGGDAVIPQFIQALNERRLQDAYAMYSTDLQAAVPFDAFENRHAGLAGYNLSELAVRHARDNVFEARFWLTAAQGARSVAFLGKARIASVSGKWIVTQMDLLEMDW